MPVSTLRLRAVTPILPDRDILATHAPRDGAPGGRRSSSRVRARGPVGSGSSATAAAVPNAVHHATGVRVRDLLVTLERAPGVPGSEREQP